MEYGGRSGGRIGLVVLGVEREDRLKVNPKVILNTAAGGELLVRREFTLRLR